MDELSGQLWRPGRFTPGEVSPCTPTHWIGGWMAPIVGLDAMPKWKSPFCAPANQPIA
jgi:hypothetical protein